MTKLSKTHRNLLEVSLGWTLKDIRKQSDIHMRLDSQITFWRVVEGLISSLERNNKKFDAQAFTDEIMRYAGIPVIDTPPSPPVIEAVDDRDWFLKKMRKEP